MAEWVIERAGPAHERSAFSCGKPLLDVFLCSLADNQLHLYLPIKTVAAMFAG
jgi:hypothetical protein